MLFNLMIIPMHLPSGTVSPTGKLVLLGLITMPFLFYVGYIIRKRFQENVYVVATKKLLKSILSKNPVTRAKFLDPIQEAKYGEIKDFIYTNKAMYLVVSNKILPIKNHTQLKWGHIDPFTGQVLTSHGIQFIV